MTKSEEAQAIIYGSFLLYAIDALLGKSEKFHGTTIRLTQMIRAQTHKAQNKEYVIMSNEAWSSVVDRYKDDNMHIAIFDFVETIGLKVLPLMEQMYGVNIGNAIGGFSLKQTRDGVTRQILKESRQVSLALIDATRKVVYDNKEKL